MIIFIVITFALFSLILFQRLLAYTWATIDSIQALKMSVHNNILLFAPNVCEICEYTQDHTHYTGIS